MKISQRSVSAWFRLYEKEGIDTLLHRLQTGPAVGSSSVLKALMIESLPEQLTDSETGFQSFVELQQFISEKEGKEVNYSTVYRYFRKGKGAKLKTVRPSKVKKDESLVELIKKCGLFARILLKKEQDAISKHKGIDFISLDEMRLGLKTDLGKKNYFAGGAGEPLAKHQHLFSYQYLSGAISLRTGEHWLLQQDACNGVFFREFLITISKSHPEMLKIIILDNGSFHKNKDLEIPANIRLIFLPPYSPELNPIERFWQEIRRFLKNKVLAYLYDIMSETKYFLNQCTSEYYRSVVGYHFYDKVLVSLNVLNK